MKRSIKVLSVVAILGIGGTGYYFYQDTRDPYIKDVDHSVPEEMIPQFREISFDFFHNFDPKKSLPLVGSCLIDIDDDGTDEVFIGGGHQQKDVLYQYKNGYFEDISDMVNLPEKFGAVTHGAVSFDLDEDGYTDLLLARDDGIWLMKNNDGKFTPNQIQVSLNEYSTPVSFSLGDVNRDGFTDIFVCNYVPLAEKKKQRVFNDENYGASSLLLLNNGNNTFRNATKNYGLDYTHNTYQAVMVDLDDDHWLDLVVAYDTGETRTYRNLEGQQFIPMANPLTGRYAFPMGIGVGDFNNDEKIDLFFTNSGSSVPRSIAKGDLEDEQQLVLQWLLFRNEGDFQFTDISEEAKVADFEFAWGCVLEDFNLDGRQDLAVAENSIKFPPHRAFKLPCRFLLQKEDGTFAAVEQQAGVVNRNYALTPLTSDFNDDGYPDLIYVNLNGPVRAFLNEGGNHNYLKVKLVESGGNAGTKATLQMSDGKRLSDVYIIGEGLSADQTNTMTFGLGKSTDVSSLVITYPSGQRDTLMEPEINETYVFPMSEFSILN